jgi:serine/threonine protein kinase/WD40 repeat protein
MVTRPVEPDHPPEDELEFASLIDELADRIHSGNTIPWDDLRRDHPQWIERIEKLMPMIRILANGSETDNRQRESDETVHVDTRLGDYRLIRQVGRGGMGVVYEALEVPLQRRVAIKLLATDLVESDRARIRFENEALAAARLKHPNLVPVYTIGELDGRLYYSMPFINGMTLSDLRDLTKKRYGTVAPEACSPQFTGGRDWQEYVHEVARIGQQIAMALDAAHESGVIHRDIKPSNIMIEPNGHVWILDFGLARLESQHSMTETGEILGTLRYMSPERLMNSSDARLDRRTDVYSLGATLYELLALAPPYAEYPQATLVRAIASSSPQCLSKVRPEVPSGLVRVIEKAMERDPRDRYSSCAEFAEDLKRFIQGEQVKATKTPWLTRTKRYVQSHPIQFVAASIATALLVTIVASAITWRRELSMVQSKNRLQQELLNARDDELRSKELFLAVNENRDRRTNPQVGWQRKGIAELSNVARYARADNEKLLVRNELAATMKALDLEWSCNLLANRDIYTCLWSRDGKCLAVGLNLPSGDRSTLILFRGEDLNERIEVELPSPQMLGAGPEDIMGMRAMVFSHDGSTLYCGSRTGVLHAVEVATGKVLRSKRVHAENVFGLDISPDDRQIASGGDGKVLRVSSAEDFSIQDEHRFESKIEKVFWQDDLIVHSDDLKRMGFADGKLHINEAVINERDPHVAYLGNDSHGRGFAFLSYDGIRIYDQADGGLVRTLRYNNQDAESTHTDSSTVCLSPAADLLFTSDAQNVRVWDYGSGDLAMRIPVSGTSAVGAAVPSEGKLIAVWGDKQLNLYSHPERMAFGTTRGRLRGVEGIALDTEDPEGPVLVDQHHALLDLSNDPFGRALATLSSPMQQEWDYRPLLDQRFNSAITIHDRLLILWSPTTHRFVSDDVKKEQRIYHDIELSRVRYLRIAPNRQTLYAAMGEPIPGKRAGTRSIPLIKAISTEDWTVQWEWREPLDATGNPKELVGMQFDGDAITCLMQGGRGVWIDAATGKTTSSVTIPLAGVQDFCWFGTNRWAIGTDDGRVGVFDIKSESLVAVSKVHRMPVTGIVCTKDGTIVSCSNDGNLVFSKVDEGGMREVLRISHANASIEEMHLDSARDFLFYRCRYEHLARWLEIDRLREEFAKIGIDW